jgi:hypothetical protein
MSFKDFAEFTGFIKHTAKRSFEASGAHMPMFMIEPGDGPLAMVPAPWADDAQKAAYIQVVKMICAKVDAERVALVVEAWMAADIGLRAADCPDRMEVLWIICQSKAVPAECGYYPINRDAEGKPTLGDFRSTPEFATIFDDLLQQHTMQ